MVRVHYNHSFSLFQKEENMKISKRIALGLIVLLLSTTLFAAGQAETRC